MVQCSIFTHMGGASGVAGGAAVILGRNDPLRGAERFITWGESTHAGRIDPGRIDHGADRPAPAAPTGALASWLSPCHAESLFFAQL